MKSPAYNAGNAKLRGKKTKKLSCGCCTCFNFKETLSLKLKLKELKEFKLV